MKKIPLTQGKFALVDDEDYTELSKHKWCANNVNGIWYATGFKGGETVKMHREILGFEKGDGNEVDHRDHNGLNNQRYNLRGCTHAENLMNQQIQNNCLSRFKGVTKCKGETYKNKKYKDYWKAYLRYRGNFLYLGVFENETDAAMAYDKKAKELFGEFVYLNFSNNERIKRG
uniref:Putative homing endonuclease n=1 Tax=viral metagenome TaxID=1070528 RepID=A0A6H1ZNF2_9ZZZZ